MMEENNFDLAIIGAGIIGTCVAWYARKHYPAWRIALVDKSEVGSGASFYSASLDIPFGHTPLRYKFSKRSRSLYAELRNELPELPIKDLNFYGVVNEDSACHVLQQFTEPGASLCPEIIPSLLKEYPFLNLSGHTTIISGLNASQALTNNVANILAKNFASTSNSLIAEHIKVKDVSYREGLYDIRTQDDIHFYSTRIMQATGPWITENLGSNIRIKRSARIKKIVAFHILKQPEATDPLFYFFDDDAFLMPKYEEGYWLFSFKCDHWDVVPEKSKLSIDEADRIKAQNILKKYAPQFASLCLGGRVFCDAYTADGDPVVEEVKENYIIAGAGAGSGYRLAPAIAEEVLKFFQQKAS
ncbi:MAG: FAD-dependent oxidoreductase [Ginsengibacter sp.]